MGNWKFEAEIRPICMARNARPINIDGLSPKYRLQAKGTSVATRCYASLIASSCLRLDFRTLVVGSQKFYCTLPRDLDHALVLRRMSVERVCVANAAVLVGQHTMS